MEKRPEVKDLVQKLKTLIEWDGFAENLPKIEQHHIKKIKAENKDNIDGQKRALFNKWLAIYPEAKYSDVVEALEKAGETTLADDVRNWLGDGGQATKTTSDGIEETDSREMDDIPDVSKHCRKLEDIDKTLLERPIEELTNDEKEIIEATKFILVTAVDIEYRAVMGQATSTRSDEKFLKVIVEDRSANFILGNYGECRVAIIQTGTGPDKTEKILKSVQKVVKAEYVIAIGVCFGAKKSKTNIGDIIVAESIIDTTEKRREGKKAIVISKEYDCGKNLFNWFKHDKSIEIEEKSVKIHLGPLASEKTLYRSAEEKEEIFRQVPQALGGEMEANGIRKAADESEKKFEWIVIKAIVDWGNEEKDKKSQPFGAVSCASYVLKHLMKQPNQPNVPAKGVLSRYKTSPGIFFAIVVIPILAFLFLLLL